MISSIVLFFKLEGNWIAVPVEGVAVSVGRLDVVGAAVEGTEIEGAAVAAAEIVGGAVAVVVVVVEVGGVKPLMVPDVLGAGGAVDTAGAAGLNSPVELEGANEKGAAAGAAGGGALVPGAEGVEPNENADPAAGNGVTDDAGGLFMAPNIPVDG